MTYAITQNCCNDAACVTVCPVNCIHPTPDEPEYARAEMLYIDPAVCIDCGACELACPVDAVVPDFDLTEENDRYLEINARYFSDDPSHREYAVEPNTPPRLRIEVSEPGPLRVAVVGSGPAGCFAAEQLLTRIGVDVEVHLFERLPAPWGLVRFGVAPDHQATKLITKQFATTAARQGLDFHLNVDVGKHLTHDELLTHHHAVVYAVGASADRKLGIPGEDLAGSHSATDFVGWYNGSPDFADRTFDLSGERAVVVGNGNVALDVARVLLSDIDSLARTDIADHALSALATSKIAEVVVMGRRGPAQAAFTTPELLGLVDRDDFEIAIDPSEVEIDPEDAKALAMRPDAVASLKAEIIGDLARRPRSGTGKRLSLRFLLSPVEILGEGRVGGLRAARNKLVEVGGQLMASPASGTEILDCSLILRSIGYQGAPLPGLPFDADSGTLFNIGGRVVDPDTRVPRPGVYTTGWIKRGPSGVIGTNKKCAAETVQALFDDYVGNRLATPRKDADALRKLILERQPDVLDYTAWRSVDLYERTAAESLHRPRVKLTSVADMLEVARGLSAER